jgi:hypothetical protein
LHCHALGNAIDLGDVEHALTDVEAHKKSTRYLFNTSLRDISERCCDVVQQHALELGAVATFEAYLMIVNEYGPLEHARMTT